MNKKQEIIDRMLVRLKDVEELRIDLQALKEQYQKEETVCKCGTNCGFK